MGLQHYIYKCQRCGTPHKHRNKNKYPELCENCAKSKNMTERWKRYREEKKKKTWSKRLNELIEHLHRIDKQSKEKKE